MSIIVTGGKKMKEKITVYINPEQAIRLKQEEDKSKVIREALDLYFATKKYNEKHDKRQISISTEELNSLLGAKNN